MKFPWLFSGRAAPPAPAGHAGPRRFAVERDRMFDLAKTQALSDLFAVAPAERGEAWTERFMDAAWNASLVVNDPPTIRGPDGFPYLRLNLPAPHTQFAANAIANLAASCLEQAAGIAVFAAAADPVSAPQFVLAMGVLDALVRYDCWRGDPQDQRELAEPGPAAAVDLATGLQMLTLKKSHEILVGAPSADYLPPYAARGLLRHLRETWGMAEPRVRLLLDPQLRPTRNLVIGRKLSEFPVGTPVDAQCHRLMWFLPPGRGVMLMGEDWSLAGMRTLQELCG